MCPRLFSTPGGDFRTQWDFTYGMIKTYELVRHINIREMKGHVHFTVITNLFHKLLSYFHIIVDLTLEA